LYLSLDEVYVIEQIGDCVQLWGVM